MRPACSLACRGPNVSSRAAFSLCNTLPAANCRHSARMLRASAQGAAASKPILLLDVMDTLVNDPFFEEMPKFFGMPFKELLAAKHPSAWLEFERGQIDEAHMLKIFFSDGRPVDGPALKAMMSQHYRYLDGIEPLLQRLKAADIPMHTMSNYPVWWRLIEDKLQLSRYLPWTFVSCEGPMQGLRKPALEAYAVAPAYLGVPPSSLIFVDDRQPNIDGARAAGLDGILFKGAAALEEELLSRGLVF